MANLGIFKIDTDGEYTDLATLTGLTFTTGTKYTMQAQNAGDELIVCTASSAPSSGGFVIRDFEKFEYTPVDGVNLYVNTGGYGKVLLNIAS